MEENLEKGLRCGRAGRGLHDGAAGCGVSTANDASYCQGAGDEAPRHSRAKIGMKSKESHASETRRTPALHSEQLRRGGLDAQVGAAGKAGELLDGAVVRVVG